MKAYYQLLDRKIQEDGTQTARYQPAIHTQGAWTDKEQHMAPATGVICKELEQFRPREDMQYARISLDIYGRIHFSEFTITTQCIRPGKTIELIESRFEAKGQVCIVARAWRMTTNDTKPVKGLEDSSIPSFKDLPHWQGMSAWTGGYIESVKDHVRIGERRPGKGQMWLTNKLDMVDGQSTSSFVKLMGLVDTMNGVVVRQGDRFDYMFPNLDLQIHFYRMPSGQWLGLDVQQQYGANGIGLTSAVLHDAEGPFGHAEQLLMVRKVK